jgi:hypothetical protein
VRGDSALRRPREGWRVAFEELPSDAVDDDVGAEENSMTIRGRAVQLLLNRIGRGGLLQSRVELLSS